MKRWKIPLYRVYWDQHDVEAVTSVIRRGSSWAIGPEIEEFERLAAHRIGKKYGVAFNSGTSALHAILLAQGIGKGDEVVVPSFTFVATANSAIYVDAKPTFADIEEKTYGLDPERVQDAINEKTRAIIPVHYGGLPCQIKALRELADDYHLLMIEDAAESLGASTPEGPVGSFGEANMVSFCGNKVITTGEGGMALTDSRDVLERLRLVRSHGRLEVESFFSTEKTLPYVSLGFNWRMSSITAALGVSQLAKLDRVIEMRRAVAEKLSAGLSGAPGLSTPKAPPGYYHVYQMYTVRLDGDRSARDGLIDYLASKGIMTKVYFDPVHLTDFYRKELGHSEGELPVTEEVASQVLTLPMYPSMTDDEVELISTTITEYLGE